MRFFASSLSVSSTNIMSDIKEEGYKVGALAFRSIASISESIIYLFNFPLPRHLKSWLRWLRSLKDTNLKRGQLRYRRCCSLIPHFFAAYFLALPGIKNAQNNGVFEFKVKNAAGKETFWTIDLKKDGVVKKGQAKSLDLKPDVTVILSDETFVDIADGKISGQTAFLTGKLKTKGNMMLASKLGVVLTVCPIVSWLRHMLNCACYQNTKSKAKL